jgi:hypothetical protein
MGIRNADGELSWANLAALIIFCLTICGTAVAATWAIANQRATLENEFVTVKAYDERSRLRDSQIEELKKCSEHTAATLEHLDGRLDAIDSRLTTIEAYTKYTHRQLKERAESEVK